MDKFVATAAALDDQGCKVGGFRVLGVLNLRVQDLGVLNFRVQDVGLWLCGLVTASTTLVKLLEKPKVTLERIEMVFLYILKRSIDGL